jgi:hypothetical protein
VGRAARRIVLGTRAGTASLSLRLALRAGARTTRVRIVIPRAG